MGGWSPGDMVPEDHYLNECFRKFFEEFDFFSFDLLVKDSDIGMDAPHVLRTAAAVHKTKYGLQLATGNAFYTAGAIVMAGSNFTAIGGAVAAQIAADEGTPRAPTAAEMVNAIGPALGLGAFQQIDGLTLPANIAAIGGTAGNPGLGPVAMGLAPPASMNAFLGGTFRLPSTPGGTDGSPALSFGTNHYLKFNKREDGTVKTWFAGMAYSKLDGEGSFIDAIKDTDAEIEKSPMASRIFQYGPISTYWQVFDKLSDALQNLIVIFALIIVLVVFLAFELDLVAAVVTSLCCGLITIQVYGVATALMSFNIFMATFVMMGMGLSVEFTCHLAAAVSTGKGSTQERVAEAMTGCFPALCEGCMTTLLSIIPLLFHPIVFFKKYFSVVMLIIIGVGALNGFVIMPSVLGLLGRIKDMVKPPKGTEVL